MMPILCRVRGPVGAPRAGAAPARPRGHPSVSHPLPVPSLSSTLPRAPQTLVDLFFIFLMSFVRCNCHAIKFTILICPLVCARLGSCAVISSTHLRTCHPPGRTPRTSHPPGGLLLPTVRCARFCGLCLTCWHPPRGCLRSVGYCPVDGPEHENFPYEFQKLLELQADTSHGCSSSPDFSSCNGGDGLASGHVGVGGWGGAAVRGSVTVASTKGEARVPAETFQVASESRSTLEGS